MRRTASSTTTPAEPSSRETGWRARPAAGAATLADQPLLLVRQRAGVLGQSDRTVHLLPLPPDGATGVMAALCGGLLRLEEIEAADSGDDLRCQVCTENQAIAAGVGVDSSAAVASEFPYRAWNWPVIEQDDLVQLRLDGDVSAIAIPIPLSARVTQVLIDRFCLPAVLAHPYAPDHHLVLTGERFGAPLPWPSGIYQVTDAIMLPPTMTICGPITWIQPPSKDSLRLSREIDVFGALRTVLTS